MRRFPSAGNDLKTAFRRFFWIHRRRLWLAPSLFEEQAGRDFVPVGKLIPSQFWEKHHREGNYILQILNLKRLTPSSHMRLTWD